MDEKTKQLLEKSQQLINETRWKSVAPRIIPQAKQMLAELGYINSNFENALTPERLRDCREQILVFLQWFAEQERKYPGAPWLLQNGATVMIDKTRNRHNELLYQLAKKYYGKTIIVWIDKEAPNYPIIKEAIEQEDGFDDEELRDLRKALHIDK